MARTKAVEQPVEGVRELAKLLMNPAISSAIPADLLERFQQVAIGEGSPVQAAISASELIYANADELPTDLLVLGAELAAMCANWNFHGFGGENGRGYGIAKTIRGRPDVAAKVVPENKEPAKAPAPAENFVRSNNNGPVPKNTA